MKKMVKALVAGAAMLVMGASVFAEVEIDAYNKLSSSIVNIETGDNGGTSFAGIKNKAHVELLSDRVDALIEGTLTFGLEDATRVVNLQPQSYKYGNFGLEVTDWYIEFRPIDFLTFGFHDAVHVAGDYLPVWDDNLSAGNFGSDVLALVVRPIAGLRIGAALDNPAEFGHDNVTPAINLGVDYAYNDFGSLGVAVRNVAGKDGDNWGGTVGVFASFTKLADNGLDFVNLGFAYNADDDIGVDGTLLSLGTSYTNGAFNLLLDFVTNFEADANGNNDVYLALGPSYGITDAITAGLNASVVGSYAANSEATIDVNPYVDYVIGNSKIEVGLDFAITTGDAGSTTISFPVYWKYYF